MVKPCMWTTRLMNLLFYLADILIQNVNWSFFSFLCTINIILFLVSLGKNRSLVSFLIISLLYLEVFGTQINILNVIGAITVCALNNFILSFMSCHIFMLVGFFIFFNCMWYSSEIYNYQLSLELEKQEFCRSCKQTCIERYRKAFFFSYIPSPSIKVVHVWILILFIHLQSWHHIVLVGVQANNSSLVEIWLEETGR
jgi:hypothetical protein